MKRISTLTLTAVLLGCLAAPAFAAGDDAAAGSVYGNGVRTNNAGVVDRTPGDDFNRATAPMRNAFGMRDANRNMLPDVDGTRTNNNTVRTTAAADRDGVDWGWLGLAGLIGLVGLRGRERERSK